MKIVRIFAPCARFTLPVRFFPPLICSIGKHKTESQSLNYHFKPLMHINTLCTVCILKTCATNADTGRERKREKRVAEMQIVKF